MNVHLTMRKKTTTNIVRSSEREFKQKKFKEISKDQIDENMNDFVSLK